MKTIPFEKIKKNKGRNNEKSNYVLRMTFNHCKNRGTFFSTCETEILPGPITIITNNDASKIRSSSTPPFPVRLCAPFTTNIAPSITIDSNDAEILVNPPMINNTPGTNSANAIGNCISAGNPMLGRFSAKPGPNFPRECMMNIRPMVTRTPKCATS